MIFEKLKLMMVQIFLLPTLVFSSIARDTTDSAFASDGSGYGSGMWWFWVAILLAIVGLAIWWASRPGGTTNSRSQSGT
ncbi:MAG TPA: hypothetical protein VHO70_01880 [Chitinispirillaceae bacterium]|nr:hypothetical protein [Chitinispirillaceae bacterium]